MSEKTPRLRPVERVNRQPLNADQQRRLGQLSFSGSNDIGSGKPFPGVARELESPFGVSGLIEDPRDLAEHMESIDNSSEV